MSLENDAGRRRNGVDGAERERQESLPDDGGEEDGGIGRQSSKQRPLPPLVKDWVSSVERERELKRSPKKCDSVLTWRPISGHLVSERVPRQTCVFSRGRKLLILVGLTHHNIYCFGYFIFF